MGFTGIESVDSSLQKTNEWLIELGDDLDLEGREAGWCVLRTSLHALRDRLPAREAVQLSAQLPMIVRGMFFDGWTGGDNPSRARTGNQFLEPLQERFRSCGGIDAEQAFRAVLGLLSRHVSRGEIDDVKACLPAPLRELWPETVRG